MIKCDNVQTEVLKQIVEERIRQGKKWGVQHHNQPFWLSILIEEVGEVGNLLNENEERMFYFNNINDKLDYEKYFKNLKEELIQVAAVAVAWLEDLERNK
ncbi:MAG: hypothetical protein AABY22_09470 [Nanoarchaeota archaeon]